MKVILLHEVPGLGQAGEVKEVAAGYARNYLLPRELVTPATKANMATLTDRVTSEKRRREKIDAEQASLATKIEAASLVFSVRVGSGGRLYGSVTNQDIANALQELHQLTVNRRAIQLTDPLRHLGTFEVPIRIAPKLEPKVKVSLVAAGSAEEKAAQGVQSVGTAPETEPEAAPVEQ
jgi:large subunit ribosomal protein L9